jgi:hypothetical protein
MMNRANTLTGGWYENRESALTLQIKISQAQVTGWRQREEYPSTVDTALRNIACEEIDMSPQAVESTTYLCSGVFVDG